MSCYNSCCFGPCVGDEPNQIDLLSDETSRGLRRAVFCGLDVHACTTREHPIHAIALGAFASGLFFAAGALSGPVYQPVSIFMYVCGGVTIAGTAAVLAKKWYTKSYA